MSVVLFLQDNVPINASHESWHGIEQQPESPSESDAQNGRTRVSSERSESETKDEPPNIRLLNARLDVSLHLCHSYTTGVRFC